MEKKIPIYFDSVIVSSPLERISEQTPNIGRLKVRAFTKYSNRNGSYITDAVADQLIKSATQGNTPVVGFFDPSTKTWSSHSGPTLAKGYGYVEKFIGWEPFEDTDGITRDYAVFSVILFTDYYEQAQKILGQNQSMELDPKSIEGSWIQLQGQEYFVYTTARILGFCIIGEHEPCFSVSAFFSKEDETYNNQFEKFSSLLINLKEAVEKAERGGEQLMNEINDQEVVETTIEATKVEITTEAPSEEQQIETSIEEKEVETAENNDNVPEINAFDALQKQYEQLQSAYNELKSNYDIMAEKVAKQDEFEQNANNKIEELTNKNVELENSLKTFQESINNQKKEKLFENYGKIMSEEEIAAVKQEAENFSLQELENKLAVAYATKQLQNKIEEKQVPILQPEENSFSMLMKKYRKN